MARDERMLVVRLGRESYVRVESWRRDHVRINGTAASDWPTAPGDSEFVVVPGRVRRAERTHRPTVVSTHYVLRPELACVPRPASLSTEEYDGLSDADRALYEPVTATRETPPTAGYLEIFARHTRPGWRAWGNEVGKLDRQEREP